jgi:hypothetical protein
LNRKALSDGCISIFTTYYEVSASPQEVLDFYKENGALCREAVKDIDTERTGQRCEGKARFLGKYFVSIDFDSYAIKGITTYFLEIWWRKCSSELCL